jgi:hypothetical protein
MYIPPSLEPKHLKFKYQWRYTRLLYLLDLLLMLIQSHPFLHQGKCPEAANVTTE